MINKYTKVEVKYNDKLVCYLAEIDYKIAFQFIVQE